MRTRYFIATLFCIGVAASAATAGGVYVGGEFEYSSGGSATSSASSQSPDTASGSVALSLGTIGKSACMNVGSAGRSLEPHALTPPESDAFRNPSSCSRDLPNGTRGAPGLDPGEPHSELDVFVQGGGDGSRSGADASLTVPF